MHLACNFPAGISPRNFEVFLVGSISDVRIGALVRYLAHDKCYSNYDLGTLPCFQIRG